MNKQASERSGLMKDSIRPAWWRTRWGVAVIGFGLVAAFYVLREHYAHALGALPYLLLLACPLMHLFMHHRHDGHPGHQTDRRETGRLGVMHQAMDQPRRESAGV